MATTVPAKNPQLPAFKATNDKARQLASLKLPVQRAPAQRSGGCCGR